MPVVGTTLALLAGCGGDDEPAAPGLGKAITGLTRGTPVRGVTPWAGGIHDVRHSGTAAVTGPQSGDVKWARDLGAPVAQGPAVGADGTVYAAANDGVLHALDPVTGRDRWTFSPPGAFSQIDISSTPAVLADGSLLWPGPGPAVHRVSAAGERLGSFGLGGTGLSPAVVGDTAYVAESGGALHKLDLSQPTPTGIWSTQPGSGISYGSPAVSADRRTIYTTVAKDLVATSDDGTEAWRLTLPDDIEVSPAVAPDGTIVISSNGKAAFGVSPAGEQLWSTPIKGFGFSSPAVTPSGLAVLGSNGRAVFVIDAQDGRLLAERPTIGQVWTAPAIDDQGNIYVGTHDGHVTGFAPDGRRLFDITTGGSVESYPALGGDGTLYIGSEDGRLYAIGS